MLLSKKTWCFDCKRGRMVRCEEPSGHYGTHEVAYVCTRCEARKFVFLESPPLPHIVAKYVFANGKEIVY